MQYDENKNVVGTISNATLKAELGHNIAASALSAFRGKKEILIPNLDDLERGDVILSRYTKNNTIKGSPVEFGQKTHMRKKFSAAACIWTHAMVYLGNMFVAESQPFLLDEKFLLGFGSGLQAVPLTRYCGSRDFVICRYADYSDVGDDIAQYAVLNCIANTRKYPLWRTISCALTQRSRKKDLHLAANCSEFALECLAIGAACMVDIYDSVFNGSEDFYPADFYDHSDFKKIDMTYLRLVS